MLTLLIDTTEIKVENTTKITPSSVEKTVISENTSSNQVSTASSTNTNSVQAIQQDETKETVWVGETGTKYHYKDCRTLKGKGHHITIKQALAEGREACKVCHR